MQSSESAAVLIHNALAVYSVSQQKFTTWMNDHVDLVAAEDPEYAISMWLMEVAEPISVDCLVGFGSAIFFARAALDHIAWDAYSRSAPPGSARAKHVYFPRRASKADFDGTMHTQFASVTPAVRDSWEALQEHSDPTERLNLLNDLSIDIRHRALVVTAVIDTRVRTQVTLPPPGSSLAVDIPEEHIEATRGVRPVSRVSLVDETTGRPLSRRVASPPPVGHPPTVEVGLSGLERYVGVDELGELIKLVESVVAKYREEQSEIR